MQANDNKDVGAGGPELGRPRQDIAKLYGSSSSSVTVASDEKRGADNDNDFEYRQAQDEEILDLARRLTTQSHAAPGVLFPSPSDVTLDPSRPEFNARKWAKSFYNLRTDVSNGNPPKTTGFAFRSLSAYGFGSDTDFQKSVANVFLEVGTLAKNLLRRGEQRRVDILQDLEGVVHKGEMLAVLGPPGSGCSTFLKSIAGETYGFHLGEDSYLNYQGIRAEEMRSSFRGEAIFTAEVDNHFPHFTVGDTLYFAARARCPKSIPEGISRHEYAEHLRDVTMAMFGISHTKNTRVGDDYVRGVSGGERKRVTIAEAALSYAPLQCWDNSTRGLDSANALEFCRTLRTQADVIGCTSAVAIYQAPEDAYQVFDKVIVLYEGRQIFFGKTSEAKAYFEGLGFICPEQQTTAAFLTSMSSPQERILRPGYESKAPRSAEDFAKAWRESSHRARLMDELSDYIERHPFSGEHYSKFLESRQIDQSKSQRPTSPFTISYKEQVMLTLWRSWTLVKADPLIPLTLLANNFFESLIIGSIFYNLPPDTSSFNKRVLLIYYILLINAYNNVLEILSLYAKRTIVEKHMRYALYHPSAEAISSMISDMPFKIVNSLCVNITLYFMGNLRRDPGPFFFFFLVSFALTMCISMMFRSIASFTKSIDQALAPTSIVLITIALYTGFAIPVQYMRGWISWVRWLNPFFYGLESLLLNEFVGRDFGCADFIPKGPDYASISGAGRACSAQGSRPGEDFVRGTDFLITTYGFLNAHRWRNFGIIVGFTVAFMILHLVASELVASERSKGEVLVYSRSAFKKALRAVKRDEESGTAEIKPGGDSKSRAEAAVTKQTSIFHWKNVCYDIEIKGEKRTILDHVDGWVKPGTLTALMGASGAGKTTLLDVLASRVTMGVVTGEMLVDGKLRDESFQRKTGYVQQQDLHLHTATVREALGFSALLRQSSKYTQQEKLDYVDTVISLLNMEAYADAIIGVPGEGLNVEQRKRLTIGVELAARPQLLLFLDEPTSGLDSQTSWSICDLMEKLTKNGQAILCTIHQPSAMLFQRFDRLLLLSRGRTIYFGDIGKNSDTLVNYFVHNGAAPCMPGRNPAEYMLEVIGAAPGAHSDIEWADVWPTTTEHAEVQQELARLAVDGSSKERDSDSSVYTEFAAPFSVQLWEVTKRIFEQYWRNPSYIYSKMVVSVVAAVYVGLSFINSENTERGLQNQLFGIYTFIAIFLQMVQQITPIFMSNRTIYEARERPSKAYSWKAFILSNVLVELAWNSLMAILSFIGLYFPIGLYRNGYPTDTVHSRGIVVVLHFWMFFVFTSTFAHMVAAAFDSAEVAGSITTVCFVLMFELCGILAGPKELPGFWIFMYRANPFTYNMEGIVASSMANADATCASNELVRFRAPNDTTCESYLASYINSAGGYLANTGAGNGAECQYCTIADTNAFLAKYNMSFGHRWRNFGFLWVFCVFNVAAAMAIYWVVRVPKSKKAKKD